VKLDPSEKVHVITLRPLLRIEGRVLDKTSGSPIPEFVISTGKHWEGHLPHFDKPETQRNPEGTYSVSLDEPPGISSMIGDKVTPGKYLIRAEAKGYRAEISRPIEFEEDAVTIDFQMVAAADSSIVVRAPKGEPASNATMVIGGTGNPIHVTDGKSIRNENKLELLSGDDGKISIPPQNGNPFVILLHESGIWRGDLQTVISAGSVQLAAWARLEVETSVDIKAGDKSPFYVNFAPLGTYASTMPDCYFDPTTSKVEKDGLVVFEHLPPGLIRVGRYGQSDGNAAELNIGPGQTAKLQRDKEVFEVSGAIQLPEHKGVVWERLHADLNLRHTPASPWPKSLTIEERRNWLDNTDEGKAYMKSRRSYRAQMQADRTFCFQAIPPGEYDLYIPITVCGADGTHDQETIGVLRKVVHVSSLKEAKEPMRAADPSINARFVSTSSIRVHFPNLETDIQWTLPVGASMPELNIQTLKGEVINFSKPKSEYVLVVFWSSLESEWAPKLNDQLNALVDAFPAGKLRVIGVNIDESISQMERFQKDHPSRYEQVFIGEEKKRKLEWQLGQIWMSSNYLVAFDGKIVFRLKSENFESELKEFWKGK